jgi:hypothetical protein
VIIVTNRYERSFARSLGKLLARCSRENWRCDDSIGPR